MAGWQTVPPRTGSTSGESRRNVFLRRVDDFQHKFLFPHQYPVAGPLPNNVCVPFDQFTQTTDFRAVFERSLAPHEIVQRGHSHSDASADCKHVELGLSRI